MTSWVVAGLLVAGAALLALPLARRGWREARRARLRRRPFPAEWREILRRRMPAYRRLPPDLQQQLRGEVQVLLAEKPFVGCDGLVVTDEIRVLIAGQAALLQLNRPAGHFPNLREILVYPGPFVVDREQPDGSGLWHRMRRVHLGESWQRGQVILSWPDVLHGAADPADGDNVVVHEFAHQLDQQSGRANGAPVLGRIERYPGWTAAFRAAFDEVRRRESAGEPTLIGAYGASDPAEFFAVASERFFERPQALADGFPALFEQMRAYYQVDPRSW